MRCLRPISAGFTRSGDLTYTNRTADQSIEGISFPCRKCLPCRLNIKREKAVRAYHETKSHKESIFLTLTYDKEHLVSDKLQYIDFQLFMKSLREKLNRDIKEKENQIHISYMVTGEYGDENKRPHWHAIIFNYRPKDAKLDPKSKQIKGKNLYVSEEINKLWKKGRANFGDVTMDSASYVAGYAAKKLVHGNDQEHHFHPIHKTSSRRAIGRSWIEKHYPHTFSQGYINLPNGQKTKIPRYYSDWFKKHKPTEWEHYVTTKRSETMAHAKNKQILEDIEFDKELEQYKKTQEYPLKKSKIELTIFKQKLNQRKKKEAL